jgi:hypothetical protein
MRFTGKKGPAVRAKRNVWKRMGGTMNAAGMCENNWGHGATFKRKWIYLDSKLLKHPNQLLPLIPNPRFRN